MITILQVVPLNRQSDLDRQLLQITLKRKNLEGRDLQILPHNQPALVSVHKDPATQQEKVFQCLYQEAQLT